MGYYATSTLPEKTAPLPKNRVGVFSAFSRTCAGRSASQVPEPHRENGPTPTATASGVPYYGYRYYNPELGRWVSRDPIGDEVFLRALINAMRLNFAKKRQFRRRMANRPMYVYVGNNPPNFVDILGLYGFGSGGPSEDDSSGSEGDSTGGDSSSGPSDSDSPSRRREACCMAGVVGWGALPEIAVIGRTSINDANEAGDDLMEAYPGHDRGDLINAYRHCLGACRLTRWFGDTMTAWEIEECHEEGSTDPVDSAVDRRNNAIGNRLGNTGTGSCADRCRGAMDDGELSIDR